MSPMTFQVVAAEETPTIELRNVETWYGEGVVYAGSATVYLASTMTYSNGRWGARTWVTSSVGCTSATVNSATPEPSTGYVTGSICVNGLNFSYSVKVYAR